MGAEAERLANLFKGFGRDAFEEGLGIEDVGPL